MDPREVTDAEGTRWTCVQAYAGLGDIGEAATARADGERADGEPVYGEPVEVVCTPSGGAQTVRLELPADWREGTPDEALLDAILAVRRERGDDV
jgi:hypothetical protein